MKYVMNYFKNVALLRSIIPCPHSQMPRLRGTPKGIISKFTYIIQCISDQSRKRWLFTSSQSEDLNPQPILLEEIMSLWICALVSSVFLARVTLIRTYRLVLSLLFLQPIMQAMCSGLGLSWKLDNRHEIAGNERFSCRRFNRLGILIPNYFLISEELIIPKNVGN